MDIKIKNSWNDVTFGEFVQLQQIIQSNIDESYMMSNIVSVLTGRTLQEIENLPLSYYKTLTSQLDFLNEKPQRNERKDTYTINGTEYVLKADITEITTGQYLDFTNYTKENPIDQTRILSCFLIPKGKEYSDGYNIEKVFMDMNDLPLQDSLSIFFYLRLQSVALYQILIDYSKQEMKGLKTNQIQKQKELIQQMEILSRSMESFLTL